MSDEQLRRAIEDRDALQAERDQLRADLAVERQNAKVLQGYFDEAVSKAEAAEAERDRLRAVVDDITAHATPIAEDDDGFVAVGYTVTVGAVHRALAVLQGTTDDPLHPLMPTGEDQPFRDWLDFVERVARPIVEAENDEDAEQAAMGLYRKASPFFICAALVMASNERDRLRAVVDDAIARIEQAQFRGDTSETLTDVYRLLQPEELAPEPQLDVSPSMGGDE